MGRQDWSEASGFTTEEGCYEGNIYISSCAVDSLMYIKSWCTKWVETDWDVTVSLLMKKPCRDQLAESIVPGAVRQLYNVLGKPKYMDITYTSSNSLRIIPVGNVDNLDDERIIAVSSYSDEPVPGGSRYITITINGKRLDI